MIEIKNLQFSYESQQVLFDINLLLEENTITGLIGPNGAGKSTLMRCIAGLEIPQSGQVLLDHQAILDDPQKSYTKIGYLPDIFGLSEQLTILQSWTYAATARGVALQDLASKIEKTAQLLNLEKSLYKKVSQLSRGQKQRVGIGQVIIHHPKLLILDEPASGLDPEARYELSLLLKKLQSEGMTLLVSSHILSELDEYCTHMLVLQDGRIRQHQAIHNDSDYLQNEQAEIAITLRFIDTSQFTTAQYPSIATVDYWQILQHAPHISQLKHDPERHTVTASITNHPVHRLELIRYCTEHHLPLIGLELLKESLLQNYRKNLQ